MVQIHKVKGLVLGGFCTASGGINHLCWTKMPSVVS